MSISTRRGDQGQTDLLFGCRLSKAHPRVHALGAVDELNAALGPLRVTAQRPETREIVAQVQPWLITLMGELATPPGEEARYAERHSPFDAAKVAWLDEWVARLEAAGALEIKGWALPGAADVISGAHADVARTVCRRAERQVVDLSGTEQEVPNGQIIPFLNRLADLLWLAARWEEKAA